MTGQGEASAPAGVPQGEEAARLRWLAPAAASLTALSRLSAAAAWPQIRTDPGAVLLFLRQPNVSASDSLHPFPGPGLENAAILDEAVGHLDSSAGGFVDWSRPEVAPVYRTALACARQSHTLARRTGLCPPEQAWACGLLAPLGYLTACAVNPAAVAACLADPALAHDPAATQRRHWGLDQAEIARRLARCWRLPGWLQAVVGCLGLPALTARAFGADPILFPLTRLAVFQARQQGFDLGLVNADFADADAAALGLPSAEADGCATIEEFPIEPDSWQDPREVPLLRDLLATTADNRRLRDARLHQELERESDTLYRLLGEQVRDEAARLETAKLVALAEFAAGAGHEINNPLAVISGQAQYLLGHASEWFAGDAESGARKALKAVIAQTRRVHSILRDLMLFARPAAPCPEWVDLPALLGQVASGLGELAGQRGVRVEIVARAERLPVLADAEQLRLAVTCLLRNALEAAPAEGWARLVLIEPPGGERVEVAVEDSGPGPDAAARASLFDPFYSGRNAGRGRGLGLPIAWRLARQQGGDVRLDPPRPGEPTRFVLTLPRKSPPPGAIRLAETGAAVSESLPLPPAAPLAAGVANGQSHS